ncbi:hypothetical protein GCM10028806_33520 [Spirosoma terrae]|uniref:Uncharacterized protein n=1 Tax=Spirosoma terrae TaxID=1968276 RepID=A0A6L9L857_9BACT|nr:hypothetical protein [Spirosoma terrae]NDU95667.1 hypothetical protein [Spirosoma terrae]
MANDKKYEVPEPDETIRTIIDRASQWTGWLENRMPGISPEYRKGLFLFALTEFGKECIEAQKRHTEDN